MPEIAQATVNDLLYALRDRTDADSKVIEEIAGLRNDLAAHGGMVIKLDAKVDHLHECVESIKTANAKQNSDFSRLKAETREASTSVADLEAEAREGALILEKQKVAELKAAGEKWRDRAWEFGKLAAFGLLCWLASAAWAGLQLKR